MTINDLIKDLEDYKNEFGNIPIRAMYMDNMESEDGIVCQKLCLGLVGKSEQDLKEGTPSAIAITVVKE